MNENETNAAPIVPPTSASGCSKSESDTPRTDTFYDDHLDFGYYESLADARRYADGWRRVFGRGRGRRDPGGKEGYGCPLMGPSRSVGGLTPACDIVKI